MRKIIRINGPTPVDLSLTGLPQELPLLRAGVVTLWGLMENLFNVSKFMSLASIVHEMDMLIDELTSRDEPMGDDLKKAFHEMLNGITSDCKK